MWDKNHWFSGTEERGASATSEPAKPASLPGENPVCCAQRMSPLYMRGFPGGHHSSRHRSAQFKNLYRNSGTYRPADSTGTVGGGTTNFAPEVSFLGNYGSGRTMQLGE
jgi:hypothetical protein